MRIRKKHCINVRCRVAANKTKKKIEYFVPVNNKSFNSNRYQYDNYFKTKICWLNRNNWCVASDIWILDRDAPDSVFAGYRIRYPVRAGYQIYGRILGLTTVFFGKISNKFMKTALPITDFCKHKIKHDLVTMWIFMQIFFLALYEEKLNKLLD
jgi:hypothetical protein